MRPEIAKLLRRQSIAFLCISVFSSALLLFLGLKLDADTILGGVVTALGSGALGACLGIVLSGLLDAAPLGQLNALLQNTLTSEIFADEDKLNPYRKVWHHYLVTTHNGKEIWRYRRYDFSFVQVRGKLITSITVPRPTTGHVRYQVEGFLVGARMILVQRPLGGAEPHIVQVLPTAGEEFRDIHAGIGFLKTWDGTDLMFPSMMTSTPLWEGPEGTLPEKEWAAMTKLWTEAFVANQRVASAILKAGLPG